MSDAIDRIKAHYEALGVRTITVPEWGNLTFYSTPVTLAERNRIFAGSKGDNDYDIPAKVIISKAQDADGKKLFTVEHKAALMQKADSAVLIRIAAEILNGPAPPPVELKN